MIEQYINYLQNIKGYSENTSKSYEKDIRAFSKWAKAHIAKASWSTITRADLDQYITELANEGFKPSTTNRRLSALSSFYRYMQREGFDIENPCTYESRRKVPYTIPNTIPVDQLQDAWEHAHGVAKVMLGLLSTTGIRIQELLDMTWEDIDWKTQAIRIHGKGRCERIVYTLPEHLETLQEVHNIYHQQGRIFTINQREARRLIFNALRPYCNAKQLSPHAIRHTFATHAATMGANVTTIGQTLGHKQLETAQKYIDMTAAPVRQLCQQYNPFNK